MGFDYCSDGRADPAFAVPHFPVVNGEIIDCPQIPTSLPTLDELIGVDGITEANVAAHLLRLTQLSPTDGHVFTLHAELEGMRLLPVFEQLLIGWKEQGYDLVSTRTIYANLNLKHLPYFNAIHGEIAGRSGHLLLQGSPFLPAVDTTHQNRTKPETTLSYS